MSKSSTWSGKSDNQGLYLRNGRSPSVPKRVARVRCGDKHAEGKDVLSLCMCQLCHLFAVTGVQKEEC